jgi:autotransporter-associated beta strand protein
MFVNEIRTLKSCAGVWVLALALNAAAQMPVGFVVNNGPPQTGVVVGRASGSPDIVSASGTFTGSYNQNSANGGAFESVTVYSNAVITLRNPGGIANARMQNNGNTDTNYYNGLVEIDQGAFTNSGTINATFSSLPASTGPLQGLDPYVSGSPPPNAMPTNNYYYGIGLLAWCGNVGYSTSSTVNNNSGATIKGIVTGSGTSYAMGIESLQYYGNASSPNIIINNFGTVDGQVTNYDGTAAGIYHYSLYGGLNLTNGASGICSGAAPCYGTGITASSYYGPVNLENAGTAAGFATGAKTGWVSGKAYSVGIDVFTYDNNSNAPISVLNTGVASGLNTGVIPTNGCHGIFLWAEGGAMTLNNSGVISANSTADLVGWAKPVYCGGNRGPDLVINSGTITGIAGGGGGWGLGVENDTGVPNDPVNSITILNSGSIYHNNGLGVAVFAGSGPAIISNSVSGSIYGGNEGIAAENYPGNVTIYNYGSIQAGSANNNALDLGPGNDTVHLYGLPKIVGLMNGQGGNNVLDFELTGFLQLVNGSLATLGNNLSAYSLGTSGTLTVSGQTYKWANFNVTGTITSAGGSGPVIKAATGTDLTEGASWTGGIPPMTGNIATWTNTSLGAGLTMNSPISWSGIGVAGATSNVSISGSGPLTLGTNGIDMASSPVDLALNLPIALGASQIWNINDGRTLRMSGVIGGNYGLSKAGAGLLLLSNANTYSGNTTISAGTLALKGNGSIANSPNIVIGGGATFDVSGLNTPFVLGSRQVLSNSTSTAVFEGNGIASSGSVSLTYSSGTPALLLTNGILTLSSNLTFKINNTGEALAAGCYQLISAGSNGAVAGTVPGVTVGGAGVAQNATGVSLKIANNELYLLAVNLNPANLTVIVSSAALRLSWPADHLGWTLQTNCVGLTAANRWFPFPGSAAATNVTINLNPSQANVYYRLTYP